MKKILVIIFICTALIYWSGLDQPIIRNCLYLLISILPVVIGFKSLGQYSSKDKGFSNLLSIILGFLLMSVGEIIWIYFELILDIDPFPSLADLFYVSHYIFIFYGVYRELKSLSFSLKNLPKTTISMFIALSGTLMVIVGYFGIIKAYHPEVGIVENIFAIGYGVGDLILLITLLLLSLLLQEFAGGKIVRPWIYLILSILVSISADILFAVYNESYQSYDYFVFNIVDTLWMANYIFAGFFFLEKLQIISDVKLKLKNLNPQ